MGALDVAEDPAGFFSCCYICTVPIFPVSYELEKCFPICRRGDPGDLEEDIPQLPGIERLRKVSALAQPLSLNMDQAALDDRIGPERPENPDCLPVAVHSEATRAQAFVDHRLEEGPQLWFGVLADVELPPHHPVRLPVHQNDDAVRAVQESPVEE